MTILVAYASKHGATQGIAEHIAKVLTAAGQKVEIRAAKSTGDLTKYDAFVIGSATYFGSWLKEATELVRRNGAFLATRPVWLFSSGPLGTEAIDAKGQDLREAAEPKEIAELQEAIHPRDHRVFFGALDHHSFGLGERVIWMLPAGRKLLAEGDFRDWADIEAWARGIVSELAGARTPTGTGFEEVRHESGTISDS